MSNRFGLKVAARGVANPASADPRSNPADTTQKELIYNTEMLTFRYVKKGVLKVTDFIGLPDSSTGNYTTLTIYHNLGYHPSYLLFCRDPRDRKVKQANWDAGSTGPSLVSFVDTQKLSVIVGGGEYDATFGDFNQPFDLIYFFGADDLERQDD